MHSLEQMLFILAHRIKEETGSDDLAGAALQLATFSHCYVPEGSEPEALMALSEEWTYKYKGVLYPG